MIYIYLDANFILVPAQLKIDIYSEFENHVPRPYKLIILSAIFKELQDKINKRKPKCQLEKDLILSKQILERREYITIEKERNEGQLVDDHLLEEAILCREKGNKVFIATNDKDLRRKCRAKNIPTVFIRQNKLLAVED